MRTELEALRAEKQTLNERVQTLTEQLRKASVKSGVTDQPDVSGSSSSKGDDHVSSSSENSDSTATVRSQASNKTKRVLRQPHPPGFKEMRSRVQPFSGKGGETPTGVSTITRNGTPSSVKYLFYGTVPKHALDSYPPL